MQCPEFSKGDNVAVGCKCNAGYSGRIMALKAAPFFEGVCTAEGCPDNAEGEDLASGCSCKPGYSGSIEAIKEAPFYKGSCVPAACPANSTGTDVPTGCSWPPRLRRDRGAEHKGTLLHQHVQARTVSREQQDHEHPCVWLQVPGWIQWRDFAYQSGSILYWRMQGSSVPQPFFRQQR